MQNQKSTKRAFGCSVVAVAICVAMLIGTTFAWFTSTASTAVNKIEAGTLAVDIQDENGNSLNEKTLQWQKAAGHENEAVLWEPGAEYKLTPFKIVNTGKLALKYKIAISGLNGSAKLLQALTFTYTGENGETVDLSAEGRLAAGQLETGLITLTGKMNENAGNEYQGLTIDGIAITVYATQDTVEYDSNNNTYDENAAKDEFKQAVVIKGMAGMAASYNSIQAAYEAGKQILTEKCGLAEQPLSETDYNSLFTNNGKITWIIYGNQKVTESRLFSFGRAANRFGESRHITEIEIVGGNGTAALDLSEVKGSFALPYNWWNTEESANTTLKCKNITFNGITSMPTATYQCTYHPTAYQFENCIFNGNLYSYQNFTVEMNIKNCVFNAPIAPPSYAVQTEYAFFAQGAAGNIALNGNTFKGYKRGINLQRATVDFKVINNTFKSTNSVADRAVIQLTDGKSFVVTGNTIDVNNGNAFWFHEAASNSSVVYTISNNNIKAPYLGYSGITRFDVNSKITSSGNIFNSTNKTMCMKKGATVAEATNLTAIK